MCGNLSWAFLFILSQFYACTLNMRKWFNATLREFSFSIIFSFPFVWNRLQVKNMFHMFFCTCKPQWFCSCSISVLSLCVSYYALSHTGYFASSLLRRNHFIWIFFKGMPQFLGLVHTQIAQEHALHSCKIPAHSPAVWFCSFCSDFAVACTTSGMKWPLKGL